jgi:hypothetical protein
MVDEPVALLVVVVDDVDVVVVVEVVTARGRQSEQKDLDQLELQNGVDQLELPNAERSP